MESSSANSVTPVAILGCGLIGDSRAALFAHHGIAVRAWDPMPEARHTSADRVVQPLAQLRRLTRPARPAFFSVHDHLSEAVENATHLQENAPVQPAPSGAAALRVGKGLPPRDCIALGQFSLARAARVIAPVVECPVLTTPDCAVAALRARLSD